MQIASISKGETISSVIYAPELNRMYHAKRDHGAYLNNKRIHIKKKGN
ncbi:TPA: hypothetical protein GXZ34_05035 [bacterium]|nr:hypothetical protein [bacterium]